MKPEKVFEAHKHQLAIREHQRVLNDLRQEDPGIPPQSEGLAPIERYDQMADYIKEVLRPNSVMEDEEGRIGHGSTPAVWVNLAENDGTEGVAPIKLMLCFHFRDKTNYTDACITAVWMDPSVPEVDFQYEEFVKRAEITDGQLNALFQRRLNNLEWSFFTYQGVVEALPPTYAAEIGFPPTFTGNSQPDSQTAT